MPCPSAVSAAALIAFLAVCAMPVGSAPPEPIAILTQASGAHLDDQPASAGLSVFEGERLQTDAGGRAALRFGQSSLALIGSSEAALVRVSNGVHVDLSSGAVRFSANELQMVEVHAEDATIGSQIGRATDATVGILQPKVLQIDARRGDLSFTYRQEFRVLPEGQVYRIYLDTPDRSETGASIGVQVGAGSKVAYYILGAGAAGAGISWMTYGAIHSGNQPISPAKP